MKLIAYNWRFRNIVSLVHFVVGEGCGLALKAIVPFPSVVGWVVITLVTVILFVLFNYRLVFNHTYKAPPPGQDNRNR